MTTASIILAVIFGLVVLADPIIHVIELLTGKTPPSDDA